MTVSLKTPLGICEITGDEERISEIKIVDTHEFTAKEIPLELRSAVEQLEHYFSGELTESELKLNPSGTEFQKKVWQALLNIPYGKTSSYLQLSKEGRESHSCCDRSKCEKPLVDSYSLSPGNWE